VAELQAAGARSLRAVAAGLAQKADGRRAFEEAFERIRSERQAVKDLTAFVEAELAAGKTLGEISDPPRL
jgi:hypothetical protein